MAESYKLKTIQFFGRRVPIVTQNENGPCPMLALANVLLLRNQIQLSPDAPEISQERLLSLIAGHLLDVNAKQNFSEEQQANMTRNIADAVELLPRLTTGIDVNIMFNDIRGFEYTDAIAIFDLLDIHLVHGWLVDPQDKDTAAAIGNKSYNALMERMVALTGRAGLAPAASQENCSQAPLQEPDRHLSGTATVAATAEDLPSAQTGDALAGKEDPVCTSTGLSLGSVPPMGESNAGIGKAEHSQENAEGAPADIKASTDVGPGAVGREAESSHTGQGVLAAEGLSEGAAAPKQALSEVDELELALRLSLDDRGPHSGVPSPAGGALGSPEDSLQSPTEALQPSTGRQPALAAVAGRGHGESAPADESAPPHAETLEHDFVVVEPEEASWAGFEQVCMPSVASDSPAGSQELPLHPQPAAEAAAKDTQGTQEADLPAADPQHQDSPAALTLPGKTPSVEETGVTESADAAHGLPRKAGAGETDSTQQPAPVLDERAMALLAALPKPGPAEVAAGQPDQAPAAADSAAGFANFEPMQQHAAVAPAEQSSLCTGKLRSAVGSEDALKDAPGLDEQPGGAADQEGPRFSGESPVQQQQSGSQGADREANIQSFLDSASSQLTEHGLVSLHQGLKPRQLAVLFRNNHFSTLFKFDDALYLLVTDQGYLHEQDVVWEKLDAIDGNTVYVGSQIRAPDPAEDTSAADLQLAMQLQAQEEEEHQRRIAAQHVQQQRAPDQAGRFAPPDQAASRGSRQTREGRAHGNHRRGRGPYESRRHSQSAQASSRNGRDCTLM